MNVIEMSKRVFAKRSEKHIKKIIIEDVSYYSIEDIIDGIHANATARFATYSYQHPEIYRIYISN